MTAASAKTQASLALAVFNAGRIVREHAGKLIVNPNRVEHYKGLTVRGDT